MKENNKEFPSKGWILAFHPDLICGTPLGLNIHNYTFFSYCIPEGVMFGFPVTTENGEYKIVQGLEIDEFSRERINFTLNELEEERAAIADMLN
jgi:malate/lactate dehydrogenase